MSLRTKLLCYAFACGAVLGPALAVCAAEVPVLPTQPSVRLEWDQRVPMRDGIRLSANVYHPVGVSGPVPTILTMTPYMADTYHSTGMYFASHGYAVVIVDSRGRGNSQGTFWPWENDGRDGYDTIAWITRQPWSNGKVGMWGGSYGGFNQWATAKEFPNGLKTIVPTASGYPGFDLPPMYKNIFSMWSFHWLAIVTGRTHNVQLTNDLDYWGAVFRSRYLAREPFATLAESAGIHPPEFDRWLAHPELDDYYDSMVPSEEAYKRLDLPILTITGEYDGVQRAALQFHRLQLRSGSPAAREQHFVVIGPWNHAGTRTPVKQLGGLRFGDAALVDIDQLHLAWYDWTLRGGPRPAFLKDHLMYYVSGEEAWRGAVDVETPGGVRQRLYLNGSNTPLDATSTKTLQQSTGTLLRESGKRSERSYVYDPNDTRPGEHESVSSSNYLLDQDAWTSLHGDGLIYDSAPMPAAAVIAGRPSVLLWVKMDVPDTDVEVTLYQIARDGSSVLLSQDLVRMRYRDSLRHAELTPANTYVRVELNDFAFVGRHVDRGDRLRLLIRAPNSIVWQKNYNSGGDVSRESARDARVAHVAIGQGGPHASYLEVPVLP